MNYKLQKEQLDKIFLTVGSMKNLIFFSFVLFFLNRDKENLEPTSPLPHPSPRHIRIFNGACFGYLTQMEMGLSQQANA